MTLHSQNAKAFMRPPQISNSSTVFPSSHQLRIAMYVIPPYKNLYDI